MIKHVDMERVPGLQELFNRDAMAQLGSDKYLFKRISDIRKKENALLDLPGGADGLSVHRACQARIMQMSDGLVTEDALDPGDPAAFVHAIAELPRMPSTARLRRRIRETARVYLHASEGTLFVPNDLKGLQQLWALAMEGEPRWSDNYPSSDLRTDEAMIMDSLFDRNVLQVFPAPEEPEKDLGMLTDLLARDDLLPEIRAVSGFAMFEWIHPFTDGNGHAGRMLMLAALSGRYSLPTLVCLSSELVVRKYRTSRAFAMLRTGNGSLNDFCSELLLQIEDAQQEAISLVRMRNE